MENDRLDKVNKQNIQYHDDLINKQFLKIAELENSLIEKDKAYQ
jgi:hypothetical protein